MNAMIMECRATLFVDNSIKITGGILTSQYIGICKSAYAKGYALN